MPKEAENICNYPAFLYYPSTNKIEIHIIGAPYDSDGAGLPRVPYRLLNTIKVTLPDDISVVALRIKSVDP